MSVVSRCLATVALAVACGSAAAAQTVNPADEPRLKAEVNAFMDSYWRNFSSGAIDALVADIYHPFGQLNNGGHSTIDQMRSRHPQSRKTMVDAGYGRSNMPVRNICILAPTVAIVSGKGVRYLTDGKVMGEYGWTYTLLKGQTGWRMVSIYSHDPAVALTCGKS